ncbi:hypothetical protein GR212_15305 [Rhizobium lusitanum]|uniref:DUF6950 domain-containing protein n=1 Tax=Rhizobium lusitanum TaxID=293958 RepID=A0A6L9UA13_9HYPH|nr:hypothetical protein [Rhizobium lusitanum]NEI70950.1 hypothetical protein [Rhizobium lusitanum]
MIELTRVDDWRRRFAEEIDRMWRTPFNWDGHDCVVGLAGNMALAITGVDCAAEYRGTYKTAAGALKVMRAAGFENIGDMVASFLPEVHPSLAHVGDIAAIPVESPFGYALGVVNGERIFVLMPNGVGTVDLLDAKRAFKVG